MPRNRVLVLAMIVALLASMTSPARGDGKYFGTKLAARDPSIPHQTALISFRDGVQTMIVQSTVNAEGDEVGWILPLLAQPKAIEAVTPGTLATLNELVQPRLIEAHEFSAWLGLGAMVVVVFALMLLETACVASKRRLIRVIQYVALLPIVTLLVMGILMPSLGNARGASAEPTFDRGVTMLMHKDVGSYEVTVIAAQTGSNVRDWLTANDFVCDEQAAAAFDDYVADGWCFAAARIRWSEDETLEPHPLKVVFPATDAVYPMRLTGAGATLPLALDLFMVGNEMAEASEMDLWRCEALALDPQQPRYPIDYPAVFTGIDTRLRLGHPGLTAQMWDGATLTHLSGTLTPEQMARDDVHLTWTKPRAYRRTFYTKSATVAAGLATATALAALALFITSLSAISTTRPFLQSLKFILLPGLVVSVLAVPAFMIAVPSIETVTASNRVFRQIAARNTMLETEIQKMNAEVEPAEFVSRLRNELPVHMVWGDVPGGLVIEEVETGWDITVYDIHAVPETIHLDRSTTK